MRVGIGFDAHRFAEDRPLMLGGVLIPDHPGLEGHSDADVVCHAIADALLGATGLGDLGTVIGTAEPEWAGASGVDILKLVSGMLAAEHYRIVNVDAVVLAERPPIAPHRAAMAGAVAGALRIEPAAVSIKATSTDLMGVPGRGEGIAASAIALVRPLFEPRISSQDG